MSTGWEDIGRFRGRIGSRSTIFFQRLQSTRWAERETVDHCSQGVPLEVVQKLATYWLDGYDFVADAGRTSCVDATVYWFTATGASSARLYRKSAGPAALAEPASLARQMGPITVPIG